MLSCRAPITQSSSSTVIRTRHTRSPARRRWRRSTFIATRSCSSAPRIWSRFGRTSSIPFRRQLPRRFADRGPQEIAAVERMLSVIRETYELYGFEAVETPFIEYTDALGKFLPDQDRPNEGVFSFRDDDEQWLSLRYDL